jgi:hypothetical protein
MTRTQHWLSAYEDANRVWMHHNELMRAMTPCHHGLGLNRAYPADGCSYCESRRLADLSLAIMEAVTEKEVAA